MVKRKILKAELRRYIRDTPFTRDEVQRLWNRFNQMDIDGRGQLNYQVTYQAIFRALYMYTPGESRNSQTAVPQAFE